MLHGGIDPGGAKTEGIVIDAGLFSNALSLAVSAESKFLSLI